MSNKGLLLFTLLNGVECQLKDQIQEWRADNQVLFAVAVAFGVFLVLLIFCCIVQESHQKQFLQERLPMAREKLFKSILA